MKPIERHRRINMASGQRLKHARAWFCRLLRMRLERMPRKKGNEELAQVVRGIARMPKEQRLYKNDCLRSVGYSIVRCWFRMDRAEQVLTAVGGWYDWLNRTEWDFTDIRKSIPAKKIA